ncbi:hypothetical protein [Bradyrhizobium tunisiense]|uniref:hypothetical protein n=1 Tax=Bradyrhizobium tunisiense TaxID=3278709 RepID=UPI0035DECB96
MKFEEKQFAIPLVANIVGCPRTTIDAWRNRLGLFKESVTKTKVEKKLTLTDVCVARAVKVLTDEGVKAEDAIMALDYGAVHTQLAGLWNGEPISSIYGYQLIDKRREQDPWLKGYFFDPEDFRDMLSKAGGVMIVIDLASVVSHVRTALNIKE